MKFFLSQSIKYFYKKKIFHNGTRKIFSTSNLFTQNEYSNLATANSRKKVHGKKCKVSFLETSRQIAYNDSNTDRSERTLFHAIKKVKCFHTVVKIMKNPY